MTITFPKLSDEELACEVQAGSLAAFEELATRYEKRIFGFLYQRVGYVDAQDLTQQTFIIVYRKIHQFDDHYRFATWVFTIARRLAISHYRAEARRREPDYETVDEHDPAKAMVKRDEHGRLWELARQVLTEDQYTVMWLRYAEDMAVKEIARIVDRTQNNVKVLLHRSRVAMSQCPQIATELRAT